MREPGVYRAFERPGTVTQRGPGHQQGWKAAAYVFVLPDDVPGQAYPVPFCLEEDAKKLDYFTAENEPGYQVHVCRSCKSYIKITDFREFFGRESIPALDDLESLPLDIAAQNEDFHRVAPSEWGCKPHLCK